MSGWDSIAASAVWLKDHEIGVTLALLVITVPWYVRENLRRKGSCKPQIWFMFMINVIGVVAGFYVLLTTLAESLGKSPVNDQKTLMAAFGSLAVVMFTGLNVWADIMSLFSKEVQPKQGTKSKKIAAEVD